VNSVEEFLRTLVYFRREARPEICNLPGIQDVYVLLLCGSLNGSDLLVGDHFTSIIVGDVSEAAFSDEKACIWCDRVYVFSELI